MKTSLVEILKGSGKKGFSIGDVLKIAAQNGFEGLTANDAQDAINAFFGKSGENKPSKSDIVYSRFQQFVTKQSASGNKLTAQECAAAFNAINGSK